MCLWGGVVAETGEERMVEIGEEGYLYKLREILDEGFTLVGFNSDSFDMPVTAAILAGKSEAEVKRIANTIIEQEISPWKAYRQFGLVKPKTDHIDLIEVRVPASRLLDDRATIRSARRPVPALSDHPRSEVAAGDAHLRKRQPAA